MVGKCVAALCGLVVMSAQAVDYQMVPADQGAATARDVRVRQLLEATRQAEVEAQRAEEEGLMAPRGTVSTQREKAKAYQRDDDGHEVRQPGKGEMIILTAPKAGPSHREQLEVNKSKAQSYMRGETPTSCRDLGNVVGQVGEGGLEAVTVIKDGKVSKLNCR